MSDKLERMATPVAQVPAPPPLGPRNGFQRTDVPRSEPADSNSGDGGTVPNRPFSPNCRTLPRPIRAGARA